MIAIDALYDAAARSGLLTRAQVGGVEVMVDFRAPDEDVLDGLAVSRNYAIRYPVGRLPALAAGDTVEVDTQAYRVREVTAIGHGAERRATLTRL